MVTTRSKGGLQRFEQRFGTCIYNTNLEFHRFEPRTLQMHVLKRCSKRCKPPLLPVVGKGLCQV
jgi:hypothetical protein